MNSVVAPNTVPVTSCFSSCKGAWFKRKTNAEMMELFTYTKYLLEVVLQWKLIEWKVYEDKFLNNKAVMNFIGRTNIITKCIIY